MKRKLLAVAAVTTLLGAAGATSPSVAPAKPCSAGWKHAALPSGHKCLRAGQFCASRYDSSYHRYGYHCHTGRLKAK